MKTKTRILSILLAIIMLFSITAGVDLSVLAATSGDYEYELLDDSTVEITRYNGNAAELTIPSKIADKTVTSIGSGAFESCTRLSSITIPNSVISIGYGAFSNCIGLTSITIPNSVTSIGVRAFEDCIGLTGIEIPNSVTSIGDLAFRSCKGLTSITIPNSVTSIGDWTFIKCTGLTSITIPNSVTSIGYRAFEDCIGLTSIIIPNSVTEIGEYAFKGCKGLTSIILSNSLTSIGISTFHYCTALKSIIIPNSVTEIVDCAFKECTDLTSIAIYNKNCHIDYSDIPSSTTIYGYIGSTAQTYAKENGNQFVDIRTVKLSAPTATCTVHSDGTFTISWNAIAGADKYEVYTSFDNGKKYNLETVTTELSTKTNKAAFGITYKYKVRALKNNDSTSISDFSNVVNAVNDKYLPAPTAKYAINSDCTFTISWGKVTGADKYEIYYFNMSTGKYKYLKTTTELSHKTGKATFGTTYKYKIRAVNSANNVKSGYCTVGAVNNQYLPAPSAKFAVNSDCTLTISGAKVTGADKYEIYSYNASTGKYKYLKTTTELSHKTGKASYDVIYKYKIRAVNSANNIKSAYCTVNAVNNKKLTTPTAKLAVNTNGTFTISWGKITGATKYEVYIFDSGIGDYRLSRTTTGTSITTSTAVKDKTYYYKVRAFTSKNSSATSDFSAVVKGTR